MDKIIKMYQEGIGSTTIAKKLGITVWSVISHLEKSGIKLRSYKTKGLIHKVYADYFRNINSEKNAYFLGLLLADGCIVESVNATPLVKIDLKSEDGDEILPTFCKELGLNESSLKRYNYEIPITRLSFHCEEMVKDLEKYGIVPRKTHIIKWLLEFNNEFVRHFIRGYFDGDGCITNNGSGYVVKIMGTIEFLNGLLDVLHCNLGISKNRKLQKRHKNRENNIRSLEIGGKNQIIKIRSFLYKNSTIFLTRKKRIFDYA